MRSPQSAVWLSWRTRPLMWLLPVFLLPLGLVPLTGNTNRQIAPSPDWPHHGVLMSASRLREYLETGQVDESVQSIDFHYMRKTDGTSPRISAADLTHLEIDVQKVFLQFPNLMAIRFRGDQIRSLRADTLQALNSVRNVSIASEEVTERDLKQLVLLPKLQHLEICSPQSTVDLRRLGDCRDLRSIEIDPGYVEQDPRSECEPVCSIASIVQLAAIPNLRVLTIPGGPMLGNSNFTLDSLTEVQCKEVSTLAAGLAESSHLNRLFIGTGHGEGSLETVRILRKQLPDTTVLPAMYAEDRVLFLPVFWFVMLAIDLMVIQAMGQLSGPQSLLIPGYRATHLQCVGQFFLILVLVTTAGAWSAGIAWLAFPAVVLTMCGMSAMLATGILSSPQAGSLRSFYWLSRSLNWICFAFLMGSFLFPLSIHRIGPWIDWFLAGEQSRTALVLTVFGSAVLYSSYNRLYEAHRLRSEAGIPPAVSAREVMKTPLLAAAPAQSSITSRLQGSWSRNVTRCVQSLRQGAKGLKAFRSQSQLWLLGSIGYSLLLMMVIFLTISVVVAVGLPNTFELRPAALARQILESQSLGTTLQAILALIGVMFVQRQSMFAAELLRPASRYQWVNVTIGTIWWLIARFFFLVWLLVLALRSIAGIPVINDIWTIIEFLTVLATATISVGVILWAMGTNRVWVVAIACGVASTSGLIAGKLVTGRHSSNPMSPLLTDPTVVSACVLGALIAGIALMASARRLWMRIELARED